MASWLEKLRQRKGAQDTVKESKHFRGMLRVGAYFTFTSLVCGGLVVRNAQAEFKSSTVEFGHQMLAMMKGRHQELTKVVFNGQAVYVGAAVSDEDPQSILKRYEDYCKANPGQPAAGFAQMAKDLDPEQAKELNEGTPTGLVTAGDEHAAVVACFVRTDQMKPTLTEALDTLFTTGELGALGELRYAFAKRGDSGQTLILTAWTDSKFNIESLLGNGGVSDAPGEDFAEVPRYPRSVRMVSAHAEGTPYGINVYKTPDSPTKVVAFYDEEMHKRGWTAYDPQLKETEARGYLKNGVVVTLGSSPEEGQNYITLSLSGVSATDKLGQK